MGLVTNKELCQVIWGIIIKNFRHKLIFLYCNRTVVVGLKFQVHSLIFCSVDREGSGRINLPALRCREFSFLSVLSHIHQKLLTG